MNASSARPAARRHPGGGDGPDAAHGDIMLAQLADWRNRPEPFDLHPVGQLHHQGPTVIDGAAFEQVALPEFVASVSKRLRQIGGRVPRLLQERNIGLAPPRHLDQHAPRRPFLEDIPAHDPDHSATLSSCGRRARRKAPLCIDRLPDVAARGTGGDRACVDRPA